jgi:hypothetical protein
VVQLAGESSETYTLLASETVFSIRVENLQVAPGPPLDFLTALSVEPLLYTTLDKRATRLARALIILDLASVNDSGMLRPSQGVIVNGYIQGERILRGLSGLPGGKAAVDAIRANSDLGAMDVGAILRSTTGAPWKDSTVAIVGKHFRSWLRRAGVDVPGGRSREGASVAPVDPGSPGLF